MLGLTDKLENIQRCFTKRLHGLQHLSYSERLKLLKIDSLECRRIKADLIMFFKIFHDLIDLDVHEFLQFPTPTHEVIILKLNALVLIIMIRSLATDL